MYQILLQSLLYALNLKRIYCGYETIKTLLLYVSDQLKHRHGKMSRLIPKTNYVNKISKQSL